MFADFLKSSQQEPFLWGKNDCALWCASAVEHVTGYDPAKDLRGKYSTWFECRRLIMQAGGLEQLIAPRMNRFGPLDGDGVAIVRLGKQKICGLIYGGRLVVRPQNRNGLLFMDKYKIVRGWSWSRH